MAAVDKRINQRATEHQSNMVKLKICLARAGTDRRALATVNRGRRRCCRPRGRTTACSETRRSQAPRTGRLGSQGVDGAVASFAETRKTLRRRHELDGVGRWRREKQRKEKERRRRRPTLYSAVKAHGDNAQQLLHASTMPKKATGATGTPRKLTDGEVSPVGTVHNIYRIATRFNSQITPKFVW